jgi:hypothetical protein
MNLLVCIYLQDWWLTSDAEAYTDVKDLSLQQGPEVLSKVLTEELSSQTSIGFSLSIWWEHEVRPELSHTFTRLSSWSAELMNKRSSCPRNSWEFLERNSFREEESCAYARRMWWGHLLKVLRFGVPVPALHIISPLRQSPPQGVISGEDRENWFCFYKSHSLLCKDL